MKLYVQPLFSDNHLTGSTIKKLGSSELYFSSIRVFYKEKKSVKNSIINLNDIFKIPKKDREQILKQIKNIEISRKKIAGLNFNKPLVMGILNVTPDSFSDGGRFTTKKKANDHFMKMIKAGVDLIDIGGESTRPGARKVKVEEELNRIIPVLKNISNLKNRVPISLDTRKPEVMKKGLALGVNIINDVSGLRYSKDTIPLLKKTKSPIIIMHSISTPKFMQVKINYKDVLIDIYDFLEKQITKCEKNNIDRSRIIIDPGIGFGKNLKQNLKLVKDISLFHSLGVSILLGASRKTFISKISKNALENERLGGSISSVLYALEQGVQIFRVHDVLETKQAIDVYNQIKST
tara:strand:- start:2386 stop:3432 length:1047 start_codon:yes stop_codon:yes gene_type:complete